MNKRSFPIFIVSCILVIAGGLAYLMPASSEPLPNRILLQNPGGRVIFDHTLHTDTAALDCSSCHHEINLTNSAAPEDIMKCGACHLGADREEYVKSHQALYDAPDGGKACIKCHHYDEAEESTELGSVVGANFQSCSGCHTEMPNRIGAFHKNCMGCHETVDKGPKADSPCAQCHTSK